MTRSVADAPSAELLKGSVRWFQVMHKASSNHVRAFRSVNNEEETAFRGRQ